MADMRLDHLSYACTTAELADVIQRIGSDLGGTFHDGGRHPSFGTRNFILPLSGGCYIEVVSALDHPSADKAPFGRAVQQAAADGGGWLTWVVAIDDLAPIETRLGRAARSGKRVRPDGYELRWHQIGVLDVMDDPQLPFFISWDSDKAEHPSQGAGNISISSLEICGEQDKICEYLSEPLDRPLEDIDVSWVEAEEPGIVAVWFDTPHGRVRID
jgi:hypothetical protein